MDALDEKRIALPLISGSRARSAGENRKVRPTTGNSNKTTGSGGKTDLESPGREEIV
jgi:hypothetical protein